MSKLWVPPPQPASKLGLYRQLSPLAGVHVSPLQLGALSIGDKWEKLGMGAMNKESSFALLDAFYDAGGNFIDTANNYQDESSEEFLGEWMEKRGIRDQILRNGHEGNLEKKRKAGENVPPFIDVDDAELVEDEKAWMRRNREDDEDEEDDRGEGSSNGVKRRRL